MDHYRYFAGWADKIEVRIFVFVWTRLMFKSPRTRMKKNASINRSTNPSNQSINQPINQGKTIPVDGNFFAYTLMEPVGVVGQIIPWSVLLSCGKWNDGG